LTFAEEFVALAAGGGVEHLALREIAFGQSGGREQVAILFRALAEVGLRRVHIAPGGFDQGVDLRVVEGGELAHQKRRKAVAGTVLASTAFSSAFEPSLVEASVFTASGNSFAESFGSAAPRIFGVSASLSEASAWMACRRSEAGASFWRRVEQDFGRGGVFGLQGAPSRRFHAFDGPRAREGELIADSASEPPRCPWGFEFEQSGCGFSRIWGGSAKAEATFWRSASNSPSGFVILLPFREPPARPP
jgi:hypothetical protein